MTEKTCFKTSVYLGFTFGSYKSKIILSCSLFLFIKSFDTYFCVHMCSVIQHVAFNPLKKASKCGAPMTECFFRKELWYMWHLYRAIWVFYGKPEYLWGVGVLSDIYVYIKIIKICQT